MKSTHTHTQKIQKYTEFNFFLKLTQYQTSFQLPSSTQSIPSLLESNEYPSEFPYMYIYHGIEGQRKM